MFLDPLIKLLKAPFEAFRKEQASVDNVKGGVKGDISRLKNVGGQYKQAAGQAKAAKKNSKMGLFSKKKKCPSCSEKLHASWDQCPYCGWSEGAAAPAAAAPAAPAAGGGGGKMRTMAIDMGGGGGA